MKQIAYHSFNISNKAFTKCTAFLLIFSICQLKMQSWNVQIFHVILHKPNQTKWLIPLWKMLFILYPWSPVSSGEIQGPCCVYSACAGSVTHQLLRGSAWRYNPLLAAYSAGDCQGNPIPCPFLSVASAIFWWGRWFTCCSRFGVSLFIVGVWCFEFLCSVLPLQTAVIEKSHSCWWSEMCESFGLQYGRPDNGNCKGTCKSRARFLSDSLLSLRFIFLMVAYVIVVY